MFAGMRFRDDTVRFGSVAELLRRRGAVGATSPNENGDVDVLVELDKFTICRTLDMSRFGTRRMSPTTAQYNNSRCFPGTAGTTQAQQTNQVRKVLHFATKIV